MVDKEQGNIHYEQLSRLCSYRSAGAVLTIKSTILLFEIDFFFKINQEHLHKFVDDPTIDLINNVKLSMNVMTLDFLRFKITFHFRKTPEDWLPIKSLNALCQTPNEPILYFVRECRSLYTANYRALCKYLPETVVRHIMYHPSPWRESPEISITTQNNVCIQREFLPTTIKVVSYDVRIIS